jgi:hypothetical protein
MPLNGNKAGLVIPKFDVEPKPRITPDPTHVMCVSCSNGPQLVDLLCEPCYRKHHIQAHRDELDKLIHRMSAINSTLVRHEARLTEAKVQYNRAVKQNWACSRCLKHFSYYGELFQHEQERACSSPKDNRPKARRARLNDDII